MQGTLSFSAIAKCWWVREPLGPLLVPLGESLSFGRQRSLVVNPGPDLLSTSGWPLSLGFPSVEWEFPQLIGLL